MNLSDETTQASQGHHGFSLLVHLNSLTDAELAFAELANEGTVILPIQPTPWAQHYGIVRDPFGVTWKLQV